jgi:hypothetical protein
MSKYLHLFEGIGYLNVYNRMGRGGRIFYVRNTGPPKVVTYEINMAELVTATKQFLSGQKQAYALKEEFPKRVLKFHVSFYPTLNVELV